MRELTGCAAAVVLAPLALLLFIAAGLGSWSLDGATEADFQWQDPPMYQQAGGSVYRASTRNLGLSVLAAYERADIRDMGYGPSDGTRIDRIIRSLRPASPLVGRGAQIVGLAIRWRIDPLVLMQWIKETQFLTDDGITTPVHNGGNITWPAADCCTTEGLYGCRAGPSSMGHRWTACPSVEAGLGLWFDYTSTRYTRMDRWSAWGVYVNRYNPCSDPGRPAGEWNCGPYYGREILGLIRDYAGPPAAAVPAGVAAGPVAARVVTFAKSQIGVPYSWGGGDRSGPTRGICCIGSWDGRNVVGFDCSGLMEFAYWQGARLPIGGNSREQYARTRAHVVATGDPDPARLAPGDLLFWGTSPSTIHHVAIYMGGGRMIEAPRHPLHVREMPLRDGDFYAATRPLAGGRP